MRLSQAFVATTKEAPQEAELPSHQLMIRAGFIKKLGSGLYTWLPMGLKVLNQVAQIVRSEMDDAGAQELLMPAVQPASLWQASGRWETFGPLMLTMTDRHHREFCFGPTHEEVITDIARQTLHSYQQLPQTFYQIQTKFRDEVRPRFGVMRAREFLMKDAYSFDVDRAGMQRSYDNMHDAYHRIFKRLGLAYRAVLADSGAIGGDQSQEFHVLADCGEDRLLFSETSDYAANVERAVAKPEKTTTEAPTQTMTKVHTPNAQTIDAQAAALNCSTDNILKTLIVKGVDGPVALLLRGNDECNPALAEKLPLVASPFTLDTQTDYPTGFVGPIGLDMPCYIDRFAATLSDFSCGANETDYHYTGVNFERDLPRPTVVDCRLARAGDMAPDGSGPLSECAGIEVGHIFQLDTKYSKAMQAVTTTASGQNQPFYMGCYGVGVSRIVAAAIEQNHDERGMIWPEAMAPFVLNIIVLGFDKHEAVREKALALYAQCQQAGIRVCLDDRNERPGRRFAEHDLWGIPHRWVLSEKQFTANTIEYKARQANDSESWSLDNCVETLQARLHSNT